MTKKILYILPVLLLLIVIGLDASAQCAMCKATVESSKMDAYTKGINNGILYMAAIPYILISAVGYIWYRNYKKFKQQKSAKQHGKTFKNPGYRPM